MKNLPKFFQFSYALTLFAVIVLALAAFWPALQNGFVNWDDPTYVINNKLIHTLTGDHIRKTFSTYILGNYQPLTIFSFAIEHHFFGLDPFHYHLTNIILHILNIILVYIFICYLSGKRLTALIVSLFFALHPMRVESVVWITERKDVLFAFFYILGLIVYLKYLAVHKKNAKYIICTFICFFLSLLAKPAAISFPLVLFVLDYIKSRRMTFQSIAEKLPFFLLAFIFGVIAIFGTMTPTNEAYPVINTIAGVANQSITPLDQIKPSDEPFHFSQRAIIACHALISYFAKIIWFGQPSPYYPLPQIIDGQLPLDYYLAVGVIFVLIYLLFRWKNKTFRFGIFFFITTIFFNLPITRIGSVEMADRFTYIPYIGLFYLLALLFEEGYQICKLKMPHINIILKAAFAFLIIIYAGNTFLYTHTWKNSGRLWTHVIKVYPDDKKGYFNRGNYYAEGGNFRMAINDYKATLRLDPSDPRILYNLGNCFLNTGYLESALKSYDHALEIKPDYTNALRNRSITLKLLEKNRAL